MGVHQLPALQDYWSKDPLHGVTGITACMPYSRFKDLRSRLHLNDNSMVIPRGQPGYDKLHKVKPLLEAMRSNVDSDYWLWHVVNRNSH